MNIYEEVMILDPGLDEKGIEDVVQKAKDIITRSGGEILNTENWGIRKLAYELNKREKCHYILLLFKSPPSVISELERHARVTEQIVKIMVVKLTKKKHIEAVMASLKPEEPGAVASGKPAEQGKTTSSLHGGLSAESGNTRDKDVQ